MEKKVLERIKKHFDSPLSDYDWCYSSIIPKFDEMQQVLADAIPFPRGAKLKMLDLGVGTGRTAAAVIAKFPNAHITGIDFSKSMLESAKNKLAEVPESVTLCEGEITTCDFMGKYNVIFSSAVTHHFPDDDKKKLFKKIHEHLANGGCFINADLIGFNSKIMNEKIIREDFDFLKSHLCGDEREHWLRHSLEEEFPTSIKTQFAWLKEIGFKEMQTVWIHDAWGMYYAIK